MFINELIVSVTQETEGGKEGEGRREGGRAEAGGKGRNEGRRVCYLRTLILTYIKYWVGEKRERHVAASIDEGLVVVVERSKGGFGRMGIYGIV